MCPLVLQMLTQSFLLRWPREPNFPSKRQGCAESKSQGLPCTQGVLRNEEWSSLMRDLYVPEGTMPEGCLHLILYTREDRSLATDPPSFMPARALTPTVRDISLLETLGPMNKCPWPVRLMTRAALTGRTMVQFCFPGVARDSDKDFGKNVVETRDAAFLHSKGDVLMNLLAVRRKRPG